MFQVDIIFIKNVRDFNKYGINNFIKKKKNNNLLMISYTIDDQRICFN